MKKSHFLVFVFLMASFSLLGAEQNTPIRPAILSPIILQDANMANCNSQEVLMAATNESFFGDLLNTSLWPARWYCGVWTDFHGWLYISSDLMIWAAYFIIPLILGFFLYKRRREVPFHSILFLFIAFILACGLTHLVDAAIFWWPAYKLSAVIRFGTAIIFWGTVFALVKVTPKIMDFKSPAILEKMIDEKTAELKALNTKLQDEIVAKNKAQKSVEDLNEKLESKIEERTTELYESNANLQHINSLFESVQEAANIGVWEIDLEKGDLYWSNKVYDIHEVKRGTAVKLEEGINFYHDEYKEVIQEAVDKGINEGVGWDTNLKLITAKKREVWVRAIGIPLLENNKTVRVRGLFQDIDKDIKANLQTVENEQNLTAIIENTTNLVWSINDQLELTVFNSAFAKVINKLYGKSPQIGISTLDNTYPQNLNEFWREKYETVLKTGKQLVWVNENVKAGRSSEISLNPIINDKGITVGVSGVSRDITQIKKHEEMMSDLNNSLEHKVDERTKELKENNIKLSAINKELESFSYSVSHDLRSPLRGIHGFTKALKEDYHHLFDEMGKDYVNRVLAGTMRMGELIDDLLSLSKVTRAKVSKQQIDLSAVVEETFNYLERGNATIKIEKGIKANGDIALLKNLIQNLLENGLKYSSKIANPQLEFGSKTDTDKTVYFITDNGAGFDMQYADKLFAPFQRLHSKDDFSGNGIGLATVKRILLKHGGDIWAESQVDKGATFYFTLN